MKKILIFSLAYYPSHVSGAEAAIKEVTDRIPASQIEFHLITLLFDTTLPKKEKIGNVYVHRVGFGGSKISKMFFIPLAVIRARALHKIHHFDFMWGVMTYMLFPIVIARWFGVSIPHVLTLQDGDPYKKVFERWFIKPLTPILDRGFQHAKVIHVISDYLGTWPSKRGYKGEIVKIHNGANPQAVQAIFDETVINNLRKELTTSDEDILLVNTARLVHQKGNDTTIRALLKLPKHVRLVLVGGGDEEEMLKTLTRDLKLEDRVVFVGQVDRSVVSNYRKACDIFVGPSRSEGLGNAFLSAMATEMPVVATQEGGIAEFLFDPLHNKDKKQTGWVVRKDQPEDIVKAVEEIMDNKEKVTEVTAYAREMVVENFNWDNIAQKMYDNFFKKAF